MLPLKVGIKAFFANGRQPRGSLMTKLFGTAGVSIPPQLAEYILQPGIYSSLVCIIESINT